MTVDREQVRRDAEIARGDDEFHGQTGILARHCIALLAELEQAERESDDWLRRAESLALAIDQRERERITTEARLAAVPALVEALRNFLDDVDEADSGGVRLHDLQLRIGALFLGYGGSHNHYDDLRDVLAAYEQERRQ